MLLNDRYRTLFPSLSKSSLHEWVDELRVKLNETLQPNQHGKLRQWQKILQDLPGVDISIADLNQAAIKIGRDSDLLPHTKQKLEQSLRRLHPWRKGPYNLFGIYIDTEWRSDWKWRRLESHIEPLHNRPVLDVGSGNGYHCWRAAGCGASLVIGIDPYMLSVVQFHAIKHFMPEEPVFVLPLAIEDMPDHLPYFETVFSMGVLYHQRSPFDHLSQLRSLMKEGAQLVLETLVVEGGVDTVLVPEKRYARMRNVWFIPSCPALEKWLRRSGFKNIRLIDVSKTTTGEQRATPWMQFQSLADHLDSQDYNYTIEGYPAPRRAIFLANRS